jgi:hypothetical protein
VLPTAASWRGPPKQTITISFSVEQHPGIIPLVLDSLSPAGCFRYLAR